MTISRRTLAAVGVAGVLAAGAAIPAIAQDGTDDTTTSEDTTTTDQTPWEERRADRHQALAEALAAELGLDTATVADALEAVHEDMHAARQTEMQARRQARMDELGGFGRGGHHGQRGAGGFGPMGGAGATTDATSR